MFACPFGSMVVGIDFDFYRVIPGIHLSGRERYLLCASEFICVGGILDP